MSLLLPLLLMITSWMLLLLMSHTLDILSLSLISHLSLVSKGTYVSKAMVRQYFGLWRPYVNFGPYVSGLP